MQRLDVELAGVSKRVAVEQPALSDGIHRYDHRSQQPGVVATLTADAAAIAVAGTAVAAVAVAVAASLPDNSVVRH